MQLHNREYSSLLRSSARTAFVDKFPGLNNYDLSMIRSDIAPDGMVVMHTHPGASETILVIEGSVTTSFISSDNTVYLKTLSEGDIMVFPQWLMHFRVNTGETQSFFRSIFSSPNPGREGLSEALFSSNLPSKFIQKMTLIDANEVRRLKALLGGYG